MATERPFFRTPLLLLAVLNLGLVGIRLWPWQTALNLPGDNTALDPVISLLIYVGLCFWIGSVQSEAGRGCLRTAGWLGVAAGAVLVALVIVASRPVAADGSQHGGAQLVLIGIAVLVWAAAAVLAVRGGLSVGFGSVCAAWSAMVSCAIACAVLLTEAYFAMAPGQTADPWKQYQGIALGSDATQALVHTLTAATGVLLIGPMVACAAGAVAGSVFKPAKK